MTIPCSNKWSWVWGSSHVFDTLHWGAWPKRIAKQSGSRRDARIAQLMHKWQSPANLILVTVSNIPTHTQTGTEIRASNLANTSTKHNYNLDRQVTEHIRQNSVKLSLLKSQCPSYSNPQSKGPSLVGNFTAFHSFNESAVNLPACVRLTKVSQAFSYFRASCKRRACPVWFHRRKR